MRCSIVLCAVLSVVASSDLAFAADPRYPDWPCTQAKVPEPVVAIWREAVAKAVKDPEFIQAMHKVGSGIEYLDRDAFGPWWDEDSRKTEATVRAIGRVQ